MRGVRKQGFTLVEMMISLVVSVVVFSAIAVLLSRTFSIWFDATGRWYLANQARVARARLLSGGMGPGSGVLSIDEINSIKTNPNWCTMQYRVASSIEKYWVRGSVENPQSHDRSIFIKSNHENGQAWLMMLGRKQGWKSRPDVEAVDFEAFVTNSMLVLSYNVRFSSGGRTYEQPQIIQAYLVNE